MNELMIGIMGYTFVIGSMIICFLFGYILGKRDRKNQIMMSVIHQKINELKVRNNANIKKKSTRRARRSDARRG